MELTARGRLLLGIGFTLLLSSLPLRSLPVALAGSVLVGFVASRGSLPSPLQPQVKVLSTPSTFERNPFGVLLESRIEESWPLVTRVEEVRGATVRREDREWGRGISRTSVVLFPDEPGRVTIERVVVEVMDPTGLWKEKIPITLHHSLRIVPPLDLLLGGRGRKGKEEMGRSLLGMEEELEIERIREYTPGDRLRDIDWPRFSLHRRLFVRERVRESKRPLLFLLDSTPLMRIRRGGPSPLRTSSEALAWGVGWADHRGISSGLVVFTEEGPTTTLPPLHPSGERIVRTLGSLPSRIPVSVLPALGTRDDLPLLAKEREFLRRVSFPGRSLGESTPWESLPRVVDRTLSEPGRVVLLSSVEIAPSIVARTCKAILSLGHTVEVQSPSLPSHWVHPSERGTYSKEILEIERRFQEGSRALSALKVPLHRMEPRGSMVEVISR